MIILLKIIWKVNDRVRSKRLFESKKLNDRVRE